MSDAPTATPSPAPADTPAPTPTPAASPTASEGDRPEWMASLPPELQADPTLAKYRTIDDFARGHIETKRVASSKAVPLPGDSDESRKAFADALRPESIDAYDFGELPDGLDKDVANGFRDWAFETGLPPYLAKGALDFYVKALDDQVKAANEVSQRQADAFKAEYGSGYDAKMDQVKAMLEGFTGTPLELSDEDVNRLDIKLGTDRLIKFMFALHDRVGDLAPAGDGGIPPGMQEVAPENAEARFNERMKDAEWRKKALTKGSAEQRESERLQKLIAQHRVSQQRT